MLVPVWGGRGLDVALAPAWAFLRPVPEQRETTMATVAMPSTRSAPSRSGGACSKHPSAVSKSRLIVTMGPRFAAMADFINHPMEPP